MFSTLLTFDVEENYFFSQCGKIAVQTKEVKSYCIVMYDLKGQCQEIFCHFLFHESKPSGPLINKLNWFCLKIRFCEDIRKISDFAQANIVRSLKLKYPQIQNLLTLQGVRLRTG